MDRCYPNALIDSSAIVGLNTPSAPLDFNPISLGPICGLSMA